jgi:hypothetical protein
MTDRGMPATDMSARTAPSSFTERSRSRYGLRRLARSSSLPPTRATGIVLGGVFGSFACDELIAFFMFSLPQCQTVEATAPVPCGFLKVFSACVRKAPAARRHNIGVTTTW